MNDKVDSNSNSTVNNTQSQALYDQFKLVLNCVIVVMVIFLIFFIYNLIKCYLPKFTVKEDRSKTIEQSSQHNKTIRTNYSQIQLDEV